MTYTENQSEESRSNISEGQHVASIFGGAERRSTSAMQADWARRWLVENHLRNAFEHLGLTGNDRAAFDLGTNATPDAPG